MSGETINRRKLITMGSAVAAGSVLGLSRPGGVSDRLIEPGNDQGIEPPVVTGPSVADVQCLPL
jgi:hypothetical protein